MRKFGKYFTWFLFVLAILGGLGTLKNAFLGGAKKAVVSQAIEEKHDEETFATVFARDWLTIPQGETSDDRQKALSSYFTYTSGIKWAVPNVTQIPRQITVRDVQDDSKDKITYVTLDVVVDIEQSGTSNKTAKNSGNSGTVGSLGISGTSSASDNSSDSSTSGTSYSTSGTNSGNTSASSTDSQNNTSATTEMVNPNATSKHFYLKVPIVSNGGGLSIMSEPVMLPPVSAQVYTFQPTEQLAQGDDATKGGTFAKNFANAYFTGKSSVDIQPYLASNIKMEPLNNYETLTSIDKVSIYFRGQNDQKKPTEKYYYAVMQLTVQDPTTQIQYAQKLRVYYTQDLTNNNQLLVTEVLRN